MDFLEQPMQHKMVMRVGTWNIRSTCREDLLTMVANELAKYNFDLVAVQEVRWVEGGS
jgi:mRNA deadenylase 3'-5' endonuclease subunit Ccr4